MNARRGQRLPQRAQRAAPAPRFSVGIHRLRVSVSCFRSSRAVPTRNALAWSKTGRRLSETVFALARAGRDFRRARNSEAGMPFPKGGQGRFGNRDQSPGCASGQRGAREGRYGYRIRLPNAEIAPISGHFCSIDAARQWYVSDRAGVASKSERTKSESIGRHSPRTGGRRRIIAIRGHW
jgi:hypothetical protein